MPEYQDTGDPIRPDLFEIDLFRLVQNDRNISQMP
jgi:hypothetical protein